MLKLFCVNMVVCGSTMTKKSIFTFNVSLAFDLSRCACAHSLGVSLPALAILHVAALPHTPLPHTLAPLQVLHTGLQVCVLSKRTKEKTLFFNTFL